MVWLSYISNQYTKIRKMASSVPSKNDIIAAHERISNYIHRTPIITSSSINKIAGAELFFKCESLQKVGAFKARGAINAILSLSDEELECGVCTHSSGNHAQALALAAQIVGVNAFIVMPSSAPIVKKNAVLGYGATVIECEPTLAARESTVAEIINETGATLIHPYNDYRIIEGQATAAKELIEDIEVSLDAILTPVGGGGLLSGTSLSVKYFSPSTTVYGCEPIGADDAYRSFRDKELYPSVKPNTIADGLLTSLGEKPFNIILDNVQDILTVSDEEIMDALRMTWERMKLVIEPSSAVCLAAVLKNKDLFKNKSVGIIISGGNVDLSKLKF